MTGLRMIDTHCHLENEAFDQDRYSVIERAKELGISIITSGIDPDTWSKTCDIADSYSHVYASIGLDPILFEKGNQATEWIRKNRKRILSVGETGLDHYLVRDHREREKQAICFKKLINIAEELHVPIQVHSRSAGKAALEVLTNNDASMVHMHAFDGKASLARVASRDLGYYFSIPTSVVRSPQKRKLVKAISIDRLLLETDSPVLGPERSLRNEPANLPVVIQEVSKILGMEEEEVRKLSVENTHRLYSI